jgi:hypothetical protein
MDRLSGTGARGPVLRYHNRVCSIQAALGYRGAQTCGIPLRPLDLRDLCIATANKPVSSTEDRAVTAECEVSSREHFISEQVTSHESSGVR